MGSALRRWLDERAETGWISSVLTEIETFRALARYAAETVSHLPAVLDQIDLIDLGPGIRILARTVGGCPPSRLTCMIATSSTKPEPRSGPVLQSRFVI